MSENNGLMGLCRLIGGKFRHNYDVLNNPIYVEPMSRDFPDVYPSQIQTNFPQAYVMLRALDPEGRWNFTPNTLEGLFGDSEMVKYSVLKDLFASRDFLQGDRGKLFIPQLKDEFFEEFGKSVIGQVMQYLTQVINGSIDLQETVVVADRYLVTRNHQEGLSIYDNEKDLVPLKLCPATKNAKILTRTLRNNEVGEMLERPDHLYYARLFTNFSQDTDAQSNIFLEDDEYSGVKIEVKQTKWIGFHGRMHPTSSAPHLVQVERVYWKNTDIWYNSVAEFKTALEDAR